MTMIEAPIPENRYSDHQPVLNLPRHIYDIIPRMVAKIPEPFTPKRMKRIGRGTLLGILVGIVSGPGGIVFNYMINVGTRFFTGDLITYLIPGHVSSLNLLGFPSIDG